MSIRLRLTLWYSGLLAASLIVFGIIVYFFIHWNTYSDLREELKEQNQNLAITGSFYFNQLDINLDRNRSQIEDKDMYIQIINYREGVIKQSTNLSQQNFIIPYEDETSNPQEKFVNVNVIIDKKKYDMLIYQRPLVLQNGTLAGLLQVGAIPYSEEKFLDGLRTTFIFSSILVVLIAFTLGMFIARQALRPIGRVIQATQQIEKGSDLSVRIPIEGSKDEISILANTLNSMLSRLEMAYNELHEAYKTQRRFVSDASHELRTPLTTIRGNIDLLEKMWGKASDHNRENSLSYETQDLVLSAEHWSLSEEAMSDISAEARRMSHLVGDLLALARADAGHVMEKSQLQLHPLTENVVRRAQLLPHTVEWKIGALDDLMDVQVYGNQDYLEQLLFIFIENAFKYTIEGSVEIHAVKRNDNIGWRITDTGIGMKPEEVPHIFDRFYRADESRGVTVGTGLGLSIAKWILDEHQGSVEVVTEENEGTTFTIWLPIDFADCEDSSIIEEMNDDIS